MTQQHGWGSARHVEAVVATRSVAYDEEVSSIRSGDVLVAVEQAPGVPRVVAAAQTVNIESDVPPFDEWRERRPTSPRTHSPMAVPPPGPLRRNTLTLTLGDFNDDDGQTGLTASDQLSVIKVANVIKRTTICDILITCFMCVVAKNTPSSFYAFVSLVITHRVMIVFDIVTLLKMFCCAGSSAGTGLLRNQSLQQVPDRVVCARQLGSAGILDCSALQNRHERTSGVSARGLRLHPFLGNQDYDHAPQHLSLVEAARLL
jgi:hypothetical protein